MSSTIIVEGKVVGQKKPIFSDWQIELPPTQKGGSDHTRLRDLITRVVVEEVEVFQQHQEERKLNRLMSRGEIEQDALAGKVAPGGRDLQQEVNVDDAIGAALLAFEDGLFYVFVDDVQQTDLDMEVPLKTNSRVTFLRLVALAGG